MKALLLLLSVVLLTGYTLYLSWQVSAMADPIKEEQSLPKEKPSNKQDSNKAENHTLIPYNYSH